MQSPADERPPHWAFQLPTKPSLSGSGHPVDQLLNKQLTAAKLTAVGQAGRSVLIRRAHYVITGLEPSQQETERWTNDPRSGNAWTTALIDSLLEKQAFGERWARHWLDVARYADTKGTAVTRNDEFPYAYTYRDWVISALNRDLPYRDFIRYQIAADLLDKNTSEQAALGFLTVGQSYLGMGTALGIADKIDVTTRGVMGLTVACARCHDHKSDPIPTTDYYALYGVFASSHLAEKLPIIRKPADSEGYRKFVADHRAAALKVHAHVKTCRSDYQTPEDIFNFKPGNAMLNQKQREKYQNLVGDVIRLEATSAFAPARAMVLHEHHNPHNPKVFERGNPRSPGQPVKRAFLSLLSNPGEVFTEGSGRRELADRLVDTRNPLTARVWVNRVWMHVMGTPLVDSPGDFGLQTKQPLQHELLDYLACYLIENNWSNKKLIHHIMTSSSWARSSLPSKEIITRDPLNQYFARANFRRKDLEAWRDSALQASGRLDRSIGGKPVNIDAAPYPPRRTIYGKVRRGFLPPLMQAFDFPSSEEALMKRSQTTTPSQALYLMNSPFLINEARHTVKNLKLSGKASAQGVQGIYQQILGRKPTPSELSSALSWLQAAPVSHTSGDWDYGWLKDGQFYPLPHFSKRGWSGGKDLPHAELGWLFWGENGAHPESNKAVTARWISNSAGTIRLRGELQTLDKSTKGNGVRARLMRANGEVLGNWSAKHGGMVKTEKNNITVTAGERLMLVIDSRGHAGFDGCQWHAKFWQGNKLLTDSKNNFSRPGLSPYEQLAQTLMLSNEFFYIE
ncbi:MAG: DUF1549 and DUF1553 domain-containing protein [Akkermansiaceae bacterium]